MTLHASQVPLRSHPDHFIALLGADAQAPSVSTAKCCREAGPGAVLVVRRTPADGTPGVLNQRASVYVGLRVLVNTPAVLPCFAAVLLPCLRCTPVMTCMPTGLLRRARRFAVMRSWCLTHRHGRTCSRCFARRR